MGHKQSKGKPQESIEDMTLNMRLTAKMFANSAKRARKEQQKSIDQAKTALKKNNEEGARLLLQNAANKYKEEQNFNRMSHRLQALSMNLNQNTSNIDLMNNLKSLTPMLMQQQKLMEPQEMSKNLNEFQSTLDNITIAGRIMDTNLAENLTDEASDVGVDKMMGQLKEEIATEINSNLATNPDLIYNDIKSKQRNELNILQKK